MTPIQKKAVLALIAAAIGAAVAFGLIPAEIADFFGLAPEPAGSVTRAVAGEGE